MSLQNNCSRFRVVGTLPISGFVSEDIIGLEASLLRCFYNEKKTKETACNLGMTYQTVRYEYGGIRLWKRTKKKL